MSHANCISSHLAGGLGNQLFQIATGISYAIDSSQEYVLSRDSIARWDGGNQGQSPITYMDTLYKNINRTDQTFRDGYTELREKYDALPRELSNCMIRGYFQSEKYFKHNKEVIRDIFCFDHVDIDVDILRNYCSMHIRRGDYIKFDHVYNILDHKYYQDAMSLVDSDKFIIFSDDMDWCRCNFIGDQFTFSNIDDPGAIVLAMSSCDHNIIANSSLSWWGAWLNNSMNKRVVAPNKWFVNDLSSDDIIPEEWVLVK